MGLRANPTYRQRRFGAEVRKLRERAGLPVGEAARVMGLHPPHLSNIEAGRTSLPAERLLRLAEAASCRNTTLTDALLAMGQNSGKGWWSAYRKLLDASHLDIAELEAGARALRDYELLFIPGLLQTAGYASAVHGGGAGPDPECDTRERLVEFRAGRQRILRGAAPPRLHAIIHEAALRVLYGGREVMREQLLELIEMSRLPHVTVQVIPLEDQGRAAFGHSFTALEPDVPELSTVLVEQLGHARFLDDGRVVARYREVFTRLSELALPPGEPGAEGVRLPAAKDSQALIRHILYPLL